MAIDRSDVEKIIAGVVGVGVVGLGIATLIDAVIDGGDTFVPSYDGNNDRDSSDEDDEDEYYDYADVPTEDEVFEADRIQREMDSMWDEYNAGGFQERDLSREYEAAQREFETKNNSRQTEYIYLDFTQNMKSGSYRNRNDVYQESIEDQFEKIQRKLAMYGKNDVSDLRRFLSICFPMAKSTYYVSLPSFERKIETARHYQNSDCIYNMVLRPAKTGIISSVIPKELDLILVGDLVFRNNLISFVVKGLDVIDENVEKFGELPIECAAACAISKNSRNLPDYGIEARDLYKSFLTRDMVLSLCEKVYPIENPEKAIETFEKWKRYVEFRSYFLNVQSQRNEMIDHVEFIKAYAVSRADYRKNEDIYSQHLLDKNKGFIQREQVLLSEANEDSVEFPLVKIEISRNLAEISREMSRDRKITNFERELRRFTRVQVALSQDNPRNGENVNFSKELVYLGDRVAFETVDILPDCEDIVQFFDDKLQRVKRQIDEKYAGIIKVSIDAYRQKKAKCLEDEYTREINEYFESLDRNIESDYENNTDKDIEKRYLSRVREIKAKYEKQKKQVKKTYKNKRKGKNAAVIEEEYNKKIDEIAIAETQEIESIPLLSWYEERNSKLKKDFEKRRALHRDEELEHLCQKKEQLLRLELADTIAAEKEEFRTQIEQKKCDEIKKKNKQLTMRHFYVYFKAEDIDFDVFNPEKAALYRYLVYDNRAEKAKIDRQKKTLDAFYHGFVKNPFLASYLFVPETLGKSESVLGELEWFGNRLNDSQKEAVRKALASNSIFLLQGPPGTGKTEVIAEITAQYVKQGKKVLVSSETHKAIDNVFDRLPKIPEIRPLRLIPSQSNKDSEYTVILITNKLAMFPISFYQNNPEVSTLTLPKPDRDEREAMLRKIAISFNVVTDKGKELMECEKINEYIDMLNDFTNREIIQLARLSRKEDKMTFDKLFLLFKYGEKDNPWEKLPYVEVKNIKKKLGERVIGQDEAIEKIEKVVVKAYMGMTGLHKTSSRSMPKGVLFFVGPTGVGKTELSKALAKFLFGDEDACIRFDMSEYAQENSDQKLIGAPPGYVGHEEGGQLTNAIKEKPFSVILFDEIEKAAKPNPRILDIFLQILEDGRLTDSKGETVYFSESVIIFTSNLGASEVKADSENPASEFIDKVKDYFNNELKRPELLGRIGYSNIVPFNFIKDDEFRLKIAQSKLKPIKQGIKEKYHMDLVFDDELAFINYVIGDADKSKGGRDILNAINDKLLEDLAMWLFQNKEDLRELRGSNICVETKKSGLSFRFE